jgi:hypothetical protein
VWERLMAMLHGEPELDPEVDWEEIHNNCMTANIPDDY